jgi:hypothetical protein
MICGYNNIYDLCLNKYKYQYTTVTSNGYYAVPYVSEDADVIRTNLEDNSIFLLQKSSTSLIETCDSNDDIETINSWDCYTIYRNLKSNQILLPDIEKYKDLQKNIVTEKYKQLLNNGILINIDDFILSGNSTNGIGSTSGSNASSQNLGPYSIRLSANHEDQINFTNIMAQASLIYLSNSDIKLPVIIDHHNRAHVFSYSNIIKILNSYFEILQRYKNIRDDLLQNINNSNTVDDIVVNVFYTSKQLSNTNSITTIDYSTL